MPPPESPLNVADCRIGFIGAGRLGTGLAWALDRAGLRIAAAASRSPASAQRLAERIEGCRPLPSGQDVIDGCDLVFLTMNDDAIRPAVASWRWRQDMRAVHCSGATPVEALQPAADQGAQIGGFHPLQTFSAADAAIRSLPGCTVAIEADEPLEGLLRELAVRLQCRAIKLPAGARARYHASGAYASQLLNVLLREASTVWRSFGRDEAEAVAALIPLARGTLAAIESAGVAAAMPGPISRGDLATVRLHTEALAAVDPAVADLYSRLSLRAIPLAVERGSLAPERAPEFAAVLREALQKPPGGTTH